MKQKWKWKNKMGPHLVDADLQKRLESGAGSGAMSCCGPEQRLMALSENARSWLVKTCERFADNQSYDKNSEAIEECEKAELIRKRRYYIEIPEDVFGLVYSENFFGHNPTDSDA